MVELLLERGADPDAENRDGNTPLLFASVRGHWPIVEALARAGADPDVRTHVSALGEITPLVAAAGRGALDATRTLLATGAPVDDPCVLIGLGEVTPLQLAAGRGFTEIALLLVEHGADPSRLDDDGRTVADRARAAGHEALADQLIASPPPAL